MQIVSLQVVFSLSADASAFESAALFLLLSKLDAALVLATKTAVGKRVDKRHALRCPWEIRIGVRIGRQICQDIPFHRRNINSTDLR